MKILTLIMLLVLLPMSTASTYTLGSHQVSFNVSEPYNSAAKLDPPTYLSENNCWDYNLNMTIDTQHSINIDIIEFALAEPGWTSVLAETRARAIKDEGIGGDKSSTMDFKGYPAYQESYPAQIDWSNGLSINRLEVNSLSYQIDERNVIGVLARGDNIPYQEILDTIEVTDAPKKPTKYAPYIISNKAGNGSKA